MRKFLATVLAALLFCTPAYAQQISGGATPFPGFGTASGTAAQGGVITGAGPTGGATTVPVITYNAAGQLTAVTTAATGVTTVGTAAVGQVPGTTTNDDAAAGKVGEYVVGTLGSGSAVSLVTATGKTVISISLTAGDWDLNGIIAYTGNAATTVTNLLANISATDNALGTAGTTSRSDTAPASTAIANGVPDVLIGPHRVSISSPATYYLVAYAVFAVNTLTAYGQLRARRLR